MNFNGLFIGAGTFALIGLFHVIVVKAEFYFGRQIWPVFALIGGLSLAMSLFVENYVYNALLAVFGISCIWSIKEIIEQEKRVERGWFPANPDKLRNKVYDWRKDL